MEKVHNPVQVFCRLRPMTKSGDVSNAEVRNFTTVLLTPNGKAIKSNQISDQETHYMFKKVFGEDATQTEIFDDVALPLVERLVNGLNSLLFTYGVTGSGKTFTMTGGENNCGILPRCLKALFQTIYNNRAPKGTFQPDHLNGFDIATESQMNSISYREPIKSSRTMSMRRKNSDLDLNLESIELTLPVLGINVHNIYTIFVSYIEIYNNSVYDLLENISSQRALQSHIVREDGNHNMYVHGATELEVNSIQEAIEAFRNGQKRKRVGQTALNTESSRSHSVFNIRLVQAPSKEYATTEENSVTVSQLSLVDLAGSERSSRTKNTGARLREAGNINNSLMKLRECLDYLRENQQTTNKNSLKKIPYRDSKLTYLFKNFFEGEGQVSMIVCINPHMKDYTENMQVLKFAEITQEVQIVKAKTLDLNTPLKRQAWNKENTIPGEKAINKNLNTAETNPIQSTSSIKKPIPYFGRTMTQQSFLKSPSRQLDFNYTKIMELEKENFELRIELEKIRKAYERITGRQWSKQSLDNVPTIIYATTRKPLIPSQKLNFISDSIKHSQSLGKPSSNVENLVLTNHAVRIAFENELKLKLQKQRKKLDQNLVVDRNGLEKVKRSLPFNTEENKILCEMQEIKLEPHLNTDSKGKRLPDSVGDIKQEEAVVDLCRSNRLDMKANITNPYQPSPFEISNSSYSPCSKKIKFDECIQMDVFASFQMMTPKRTTRKSIEHSTPYQVTLSNCKGQLDIFNESITPRNCKSLRNFSLTRDPDFDKRENELSLKMEKHRKKQKENRRLMDILYSIRRTSSASNLFNITLSRKNSFQEKSKQRSFSDNEL